MVLSSIYVHSAQAQGIQRITHIPCLSFGSNSIQVAFHNNFPRFLDFGFRRKLTCTKTQQVTDKASRHNGCAVFLRDLVFRTYQQKWCQLCFIIYPLFILLPHNLRQLPFSPPPLPLPPPPSEHAAVIIYRVSVTMNVEFPFLHPLVAAIAPIQRPHTGNYRRHHVGRNICR